MPMAIQMLLMKLNLSKCVPGDEKYTQLLLSLYLFIFPRLVFFSPDSLCALSLSIFSDLNETL